MSKRLRLGLDVDEIIVDFIAAFRQEAEAVLGRSFKLPPDSWAFNNWKITRKEIHTVWNHIKETDNWFFNNCTTLPFVAENLPWLTENHEVYFITARIPTAGFSIQQQTQMHLSEIGVQFPTVLVERNKGPIAAALKLDAFVDDKIENLIDVDNATEYKTKIFLMNQPHNESFQEPAHWTRVHDFEEFVQHIQEMN
jgi:uncharacterized HAD superfamily protein